MAIDEPTPLRWVGTVTLAVLGGAATLAVALAVPADRGAALRVYAIFVGALAARLLVRAIVVTTRTPGERAFDRAARALAPTSRRRAQEPLTIERLLRSSTSRAMELHFRLRPRLREIAAHRLAEGHGVILDEDVEAARRLLGEEAWQLVRPDRDPPDDRFGSGAPLAELERIVTALEGL